MTIDMPISIDLNSPGMEDIDRYLKEGSGLEMQIGEKFRITIPTSIMTVFNLESDVEYDWVSIQGLPALRKKADQPCQRL